MSGLADWALAARLARRELRGGVRGFRLLVACLGLGVAAITAVGTLDAMLVAGLRDEARTILGGDVAVRQIHQPPEPAVRDLLADGGTVSATRELRAMAHAGDGARTLVEMKAVDAAWPLYGTLVTAPALPRDGLLAPRAAGDGATLWGAAIEPALADKLAAGIGDRLTVGAATFEVRALIEREPDRLGGGTFRLGPRLLASAEALDATGLIQPGSLVSHSLRVRLPPGSDAAALAARLDDGWPDAPWRVRTPDEASPGVTRLVGRLSLFLGLVGLTALLIGGVGVANAVTAHLARKPATIATLKCLGAPATLVFRVYLLETLAIAGLGLALGLVLGVGVALAASLLLGDLLPVAIDPALLPWPVLRAAVFGLLTALAFAIVPVARAARLSPALLFRAAAVPPAGMPPRAYLAAAALCAAGLAALAIVAAPDARFAAFFVAGAAAAFLVLRLAAVGVAALARRWSPSERPLLRLGIAALYRPGAATAPVIVSLGLGLAVLVAVVTVEGNLARQFREELPETAPAFFFLDIQPDQLVRFRTIVAGTPGTGAVEDVPMLRGRIVELNGRPAGEVEISPDARWALDGDRGITWAATAPENSPVVEGTWWPADYSGPPLVSVEANIARGLGLGVGDTLAVNVLGRTVQARVASLRKVEWNSLAINFVMIFSPGPLDGAPRMHVAIVHAAPAAESPLERAVTDAFANISAVRVREALEEATALAGQVATGVRAAAATALVAGTLVLAGALAAGERRRLADGAVLKVLGARRRDVLAAWLAELALLALAAAIVAGIAGTLAGWAVTTQVLRLPWTLLPGTVLATLAIAVLATVALGLAGTWRALGAPAAPLLREP
ncbi:MAG: ABC transporter permease [Alphaproteobacteria bacterium]